METMTTAKPSWALGPTEPRRRGAWLSLLGAGTLALTSGCAAQMLGPPYPDGGGARPGATAGTDGGSRGTPGGGSQGRPPGGSGPAPDGGSPGSPDGGSGGGSGEFQISGTKIIDPDGNLFVPKGANVNGYEWVWNESTVGSLSDIVDCWKYNTVRVNNLLLTHAGSPQWSTNDDLEAIVTAFTAKKVVVILSAHDWTCDYPTGGDLTLLRNWLTGLATKYKSNPYVWFEPTNEPGGGTDSATHTSWVSTFQDLISSIRATGANNPIVVDGTNCGQEGGYVPVSQLAAGSAIISWGKELLSFGGRSYPNVVFSYHVYEQWNDNANGTSAERQGAYLDLVAGQNLAIFAGEYGVQNVNYTTSTAVRGLFQSAVSRNVGRVAWHWSGGAGNNQLTVGGGGLDIDSCTSPTNLTACEGQASWQDSHGNPSPTCTP